MQSSAAIIKSNHREVLDERGKLMEESKTAIPHYMGTFGKINKHFIYFEKIVLTFCTIVLVIAIFIQVICRYILMISTPWAEELARYLFVWMSYLGGGYALHTGGQIEIDIAPTIINSLKGISTAVKEKIVLWLKTAGLVITMIFLLGFCWVFGNYIMFIAGGSQTSQTMHIPMWIVYFPVLIGSLMTVWHGAYRILCNVFHVTAHTD